MAQRETLTAGWCYITFGGYGHCSLPVGHEGQHRDPSGYSFNLPDGHPGKHSEPLTPQEMFKREVETGALTQTGIDDCGCPIFQVTPERRSALMGETDSLVAHVKPCTWHAW